MGVVGANGTEAGSSSCGVIATGDKVEVKKAEGRFVAEGGGEKSNSGSGDTTDPNLLGQEAGDSGIMDGLTVEKSAGGYIQERPLHVIPSFRS